MAEPASERRERDSKTLHLLARVRRLDTRDPWGATTSKYTYSLGHRRRGLQDEQSNSADGATCSLAPYLRRA